MHDPAVSFVASVLDRVEEVSAIQRDAAREPQRLREVSELAGGGVVQSREVEHEGQHEEVGGEEHVVRQAEVLGGGEGVAAEEVDDVGEEIGGGVEGEEEGLEGGDGAGDEDGDEGLDAGVGGEVGEGDGGEGEGGDAGGEGREEGFLGGGGEVGVGDEGDGKVVVEVEELGEFEERGEVARARAREDGHARGFGAAGSRHGWMALLKMLMVVCFDCGEWRAGEGFIVRGAGLTGPGLAG